MRLWVSMHVSDHSGFHYRQFLLKALLTELCKAPECTAAATTTTTTALRQRGIPPPSAGESTRAAFRWEESSESWQPGTVTRARLFDLEVEFCSELIHSFPGHETLWCHR